MARGSGWNQWVWLVGVVVRRYIDFLILLIPSPRVSVLFLQQHPYFLLIFLCFSFFKNYIVNILAVERTRKLTSLTIQLIGCKHPASEGMFYIGSHRFVCRIIEPDTFACCTFIFALSGYLDTRRNI